ncbi:hypothetical protein J5N97_017101 [Dioscorea zingiberensis]|uniref:UspA domain-containing protein n=1 Tax=Dioscorea zingiberensis TaxID=325984 RepID=A0A9D5HFT8_9LILI|nr:hypothetical protein J5N97_017101 [Dioscorea zingiberensis]
MDFSKSSKRALTWAISNLLNKGDTLILLHVIQDELDEAKHALWVESGSRDDFDKDLMGKCEGEALVSISWRRRCCRTWRDAGDGAGEAVAEKVTDFEGAPARDLARNEAEEEVSGEGELADLGEMADGVDDR